MATPALASLSSRYPEAAVDVAVGRWARPALARNPRVRRLVDTGSLIGGQRPSPRTFVAVARRLRRGHYDGALVLERSLWFALLTLAAGIPVRVGFDSGGRGATHTLALPADGIQHEADRYLELARLLGATDRPRRMEFDPGLSGIAEAEAALRRFGWTGEPFAVLHPGGGTNPGMRLTSKRWPADRYAAIARRLDADGLRPIVVAGAGEAPLRESVCRAAGGATLALDDGLSLAGLGGLAARAGVYVGNDTGPSHLALAVGTPTVIVFGPSDERCYGPYGWRSDGSAIGEAVSEPALGPNDPAPRWLDRTTEAVSVERVWEAVRRVLDRAEPT